MKNINDLELGKGGWRDYISDLTTDALWVSNKQDKFEIPDRGFDNSTEFHGIFIHEIPYQMIKRYTKQDEVVWDCFGGAGTTWDVCQLLKRECVINDLIPAKDYILSGDSKNFNPGKPVQMVIMHPPYWNIVKYSKDNNDLSNCTSLADFYSSFTEIVKNVNRYLVNERFLILVCGHIYYNGEDICLGYDCMQIIRKLGYKCKGVIVKDYGETKGGHKQRANLEYYRALKNGYWKFAGDNIFVLQKNNSEGN